MASVFQVGDLVWAKMKGFCAWPAKVVAPLVDVPKPKSKKGVHYFVFFYGQENHAWVPEENVFHYMEFKERFIPNKKIPAGIMAAVQEIEKARKSQTKAKAAVVKKRSSLPETAGSAKKRARTDSSTSSSATPPAKKFTAIKSAKKSAATSGDESDRSTKEKKEKKDTEKKDTEKKEKKEKKKPEKDKSPKLSITETMERLRETAKERRRRRAESELMAIKMKIKSDILPLSPKKNLGRSTPPATLPRSSLADSPEREPIMERLAREQSEQQDDDDETLANGELPDIDSDQDNDNDLIMPHKFGVNSRPLVIRTVPKPDIPWLDNDEGDDEAMELVTVEFPDEDNELSNDEPLDDVLVEETCEQVVEKVLEEVLDKVTGTKKPEPEPAAGSGRRSGRQTVKVNREIYEPKPAAKKTPKAATPAPKATTSQKGAPSQKATPGRKRASTGADIKSPKPKKQKNTKPGHASTEELQEYNELCGSPSKNMIATPAKIGFLGLGIMGHSMCRCLLTSGHEVTVWNRTESKCTDLVKAGALQGQNPQDVVDSCDITFSCVSDPEALKDLVFGNQGVLNGMSPGKGYVDMSTVDMETIIDINEAITTRGGRFLEAPVSGSKIPAQQGQLVILAAGDRTLYEDCFSCFGAMGKKTFFLGETGKGVQMKLVINMLMGTWMAGLAEAMALAEKVGLDHDELIQALELGAMNSGLLSSKGRAIMESKFTIPHFPLQHQQKDMRLALAMADTADQPLYVGAAANELFKKAKAKGCGDFDVAAVYRAAAFN